MAVDPLLSRDPANGGSLQGLLDTVLNKHSQGMEGQLPAIVVSYDRDANRAVVQPLINRLSTTGEQLERGVISSVPVIALGGGGFFLNFPLKAGDKGWIEASDRDISLFLQGGEKAQPNTIRMHKFADGRFIPDMFGDYTVSGEDTDKMVIQSKDGTVKLTLSDDEVHVKGPKIFLEAMESLIGTAPKITLNGPVEMPNGATIAGVSFNNHVHDDPHGGQTGGPRNP